MFFCFDQEIFVLFMFDLNEQTGSCAQIMRRGIVARDTADCMVIKLGEE
jgi:hypothetical protein